MIKEDTIRNNKCRKICPEKHTLYRSRHLRVSAFFSSLPSINLQLKLHCISKNSSSAALLIFRSSSRSFRGYGERCEGIWGHWNAGSFKWYVRASDRTSPAHEMWVEKHHHDRDVIVEMAADPTVDFLQVWVSHLSLLCCLLQCCLHQSPCTSLHYEHDIIR